MILFMGSSLLLLACDCALDSRLLVGIRFLFYTVGGTGNPEGWPRGEFAGPLSISLSSACVI